MKNFVYIHNGMETVEFRFAYKHKETKKNLCRGGRSHDLQDTDF